MPPFLPPEILTEILSYITDKAYSQRDLYSCCLISKSWYYVAVWELYKRPQIRSSNFQLFVRTLCPSLNVHVKRSTLSDLVRVLDMSALGHDSSKSTTGRLLSRTKAGLVEFVAPQTSLGVNSFAALSRCDRLTKLDLSLVSESIRMSDLDHALQRLAHLTHLSFPRSANQFDTAQDAWNFHWPKTLTTLYLSGGATATFLDHIVRKVPPNIPMALETLHISHNPSLRSAVLRSLLFAVGALPTFTNLSVHHVPHVDRGTMDDIIFVCPHLTSLSLTADFLTD
ncbi:hypothetical protein K402DRAFT_337650, partial [Aulographum hederae CBS 113979]